MLFVRQKRKRAAEDSKLLEDAKATAAAKRADMQAGT